MTIINDNKYKHLTNYFAAEIEKIGEKGTWQKTRMGIYKDYVQIGEYVRTYPAFGESTFHPFKGKDDQWYALYSADYCYTRVMTLPDCKDIGGESEYKGHFCPVEYFIPTWQDHTYSSDYKAGKKLEVPELVTFRINNPAEKDLTHTPIQWYDFAFVAGCIWGDDSSWKVQYIDLSDPYNIKRIERFGYLELPGNQSLREAVDMAFYDPASYRNITFNTQLSFSMREDKFEEHYLPFKDREPIFPFIPHD